MFEPVRIGGTRITALDFLSIAEPKKRERERREQEREYYRVAKTQTEQRCYGVDELARRIGVKARRARAFAAHLRERGIGVLGVDGVWFSEVELCRAVTIWRKSSAAQGEKPL